MGRQSIRVLNSSIHSTRYYRHTSSIHRPSIRVPTPFPVIESCPSPTCPCRPAPADLDIDREQSLNGTMAAYSEQVLVCTGREDWKSRIEDEEGEHGELVRQLRALLGRGGKFCDVSLIPKTHHAPPVLSWLSVSPLRTSVFVGDLRRLGRPGYIPTPSPKLKSPNNNFHTAVQQYHAHKFIPPACKSFSFCNIRVPPSKFPLHTFPAK